MTDLSSKILSDYQVRKTKEQKTAFIELLKNEFPALTVEQGGFLKSRNLIVGDINNAEVILSAHYDTCARLPFPNFITPKNWFGILAYNILICIPFFAFFSVAFALLRAATGEFFLSYWISIIAMVALFIYVFMGGKPNEHTVNDNTSGVIMLVELLQRLSEEEKERTAFVFFDNEENGLLGSSFFKKKYQKLLKEKLLINFDCVSDGDNIMLVCSKPALELYGEDLKQSFVSSDEKNLLIEKSSNTFYPSDQMGFPNGIGVAALKKMPVLGYYMDRIHTKRDTIMDERNIQYLCDLTKTFIGTLSK